MLCACCAAALIGSAATRKIMISKVWAASSTGLPWGDGNNHMFDNSTDRQLDNHQPHGFKPQATAGLMDQIPHATTATHACWSIKLVTHYYMHAGSSKATHFLRLGQPQHGQLSHVTYEHCSTTCAPDPTPTHSFATAPPHTSHLPPTPHNTTHITRCVMSHSSLKS